MDNKDTTLVMHDWPIVFWIIGAALLVEGVTFFLPVAEGSAALYVRAGLCLVGLVILLFSSILTVTADRVTQTLTISHRSLLRGSQREILFSQIDSIDLQSMRSSSRSSTTYRIVVFLKTGEMIPFHSYYSSGSFGMYRKINRLRDFIGMEALDVSFKGMFKRATQVAQTQYRQQQEAMTGSEDELHETNGVRWKVQTVAFGGQPITRWFSADYCLPGGFVYITQLAEGQKMLGGPLGGLAGMLYKQSLSMYGFGPEDTPGIETAEVLTDIDPDLMRSFSVYTSAVHNASQVLNPGTIASLVDWAQHYPLKTINTGRHVFLQLVVMFSPQGVYVGSMGTMIPEAIEEMARLGVEIIKSQA